MNSIKISLKNNKKFIKIILLLLLIGFFIGFLLSKKLESEVVIEEIKSIESYLNTNRINFLSNHILTLIILSISSIFIIGLIFFPISIIYEGICLYFNTYIFTQVFNFKGLLYSIIYNTLTKGIYLLLLIIIFKKIIILIKRMLAKNNQNEKKTLILKSLKQISICTFLIILNDILIFLIGNKILSIFLFMIK